MKCARCEVELLSYERAQEVHWGGLTVRPPSFCTECLRANLWPGGSRSSLDRLVRGELDVDEVARVVEATRGWA